MRLAISRSGDVSTMIMRLTRYAIAALAVAFGSAAMAQVGNSLWDSFRQGQQDSQIRQMQELQQLQMLQQIQQRQQQQEQERQLYEQQMQMMHQCVFRRKVNAVSDGT